MKASQLINKLEKLIEEHGDLEVIYWYEEAYDQVEEVDWIDIPSLWDGKAFEIA